MPFSPKRTTFPPSSSLQPSSSSSLSFSSFLPPLTSSSSSLLPTPAPSPPSPEEPFSPRGVDDHDGNWEKERSVLVADEGGMKGETDLDGGDLERAFRRRRRGEDDEDEEGGFGGGSGKRSSLGDRWRGRWRGACGFGGLKGRRTRSSLFLFLLVGSFVVWFLRAENESLASLYDSMGLGGKVLVDTRLMPWTHLERDTIVSLSLPSLRAQHRSPLPSSSPSRKLTHPPFFPQIFYTILGSDLPPRHSPNQTLVNLSFLLQNENLTLPFPNSQYLPHTYLPPTLKIERRFLLNRLVPGPERDALVELLGKWGKSWEEVEWKDERWREVGFRCESRRGCYETIEECRGREGWLTFCCVLLWVGVCVCRGWVG